MSLPSAYQKAIESRSASSSQEAAQRTERAKRLVLSINKSIRRTGDRRYVMVPAKDWESILYAVTGSV